MFSSLECQGSISAGFGRKHAYRKWVESVQWWNKHIEAWGTNSKQAEWKPKPNAPKRQFLYSTTVGIREPFASRCWRWLHEMNDCAAKKSSPVRSTAPRLSPEYQFRCWNACSATHLDQNACFGSGSIHVTEYWVGNGLAWAVCSQLKQGWRPSARNQVIENRRNPAQPRHLSGQFPRPCRPKWKARACIRLWTVSLARTQRGSSWILSVLYFDTI